jgi:hypothetical protein
MPPLELRPMHSLSHSHTASLVEMSTVSERRNEADFLDSLQKPHIDFLDH